MLMVYRDLIVFGYFVGWVWYCLLYRWRGFVLLGFVCFVWVALLGLVCWVV